MPELKNGRGTLYTKKAERDDCRNKERAGFFFRSRVLVLRRRMQSVYHHRPFGCSPSARGTGDFKRMLF